MLYPRLDMLTIFFRDCLRGSRRQSDTVSEYAEGISEEKHGYGSNSADSHADYDTLLRSVISRSRSLIDAVQNEKR